MFSRYHLKDPTFTINGKTLGQGWLIISEEEYQQLRTPKPVDVPSDTLINERINRHIPGFRWRTTDMKVHPNALRSIVGSLLADIIRLTDENIAMSETISSRGVLDSNEDF